MAYEKVAVGDMLNFYAYLEGIQVPVAQIMIEAKLDSPAAGAIDIPYIEEFLDISSRLTISDGTPQLHGLQPFTRVHIFYKLNDSQMHLIMSGIVTGATSISEAKKYIRILFTADVGLLGIHTLMPYIPAVSENIIIANAATAQRAKGRSVDTGPLEAENNDLVVLQNQYRTMVQEIKGAVGEYIEDPTPEKFKNAFLSQNAASRLIDLLLRLEDSVSFYKNEYMLNLLKGPLAGLGNNSDSEANSVKPLAALIEAILETQLPAAANKTTAEMILQTLFKEMGLYYTPIINPAYIKTPHTSGKSAKTILQLLGLPDLTNYPPPAGNIFYAESVGGGSLPSYNFLNTPTRVITSYTLSYSTENGTRQMQLRGLAPAEFRELLTQRLTSQSGEENDDVTAKLNMTFLPSEYIYGQRILSYNLNDWLAQILSSNTIALSNGLPPQFKLHIINYLNAKADYIYIEGYRKRSTRQIHMRQFQPYVMVGLPGAVVGEKEIQVGLVTGVSYQIQPGNISTTVTLSGLHPYKETPPIRNPLLDKESGSLLNIYQSIYKKYFNTSMYNDEKLEAIRRWSNHLRVTEQQDALAQYLHRLNYRPIATFNEVDSLLGYGFTRHHVYDTFNVVSQLYHNQVGLKTDMNISTEGTAAFDKLRAKNVEEYKKALIKSGIYHAWGGE